MFNVQRMLQRKGCNNLPNTHDRRLFLWVAPFAIALLTFISLLIPVLLPIAVYFSVNCDARKGTWIHTAAMGGTALLGGLWIWGYAGLGWLLLCLVPAVTALICYKKKFSFGDGLIYSVAAALLSLAALMVIVTLQHGRNPILLITDALETQIRRGGETGPLYGLLGSQQAMMEWSGAAGGGGFSALSGLMNEITHLPVEDFIERVIPTYEQLLRLYAPTAIVAATMAMAVFANEY